MLACAVARQWVKTVAGRVLEIVQSFGSIDQEQLCQPPRLDIGRHLAAALAVPELVGFGIGEGLDRDCSMCILMISVLALRPLVEIKDL